MRAGKFARHVCCALTMMWLVNPVQAADELTRRQKDFIRELYERKDYFTCIAETRRLLNGSSGLTNHKDYLYFIEANYFLAGQYRTVIENLKATPLERANLPHILLASMAYGKTGRCDEGLKILESFDPSPLGKNERCRFMAVKSELFFQAGLLGRAQQEIQQGREYASCARLAGLGEALGGYKEIPRRSPVLAAILSAVLPGAGQAYAGRHADGAISFISVAGLATGALLCFHHRERALGATLSAAASLVYAGNVYGAYNAASRYNAIEDDRFRARLIEHHVPRFNPMEGLDLERLMR